MPRRNKNVSDYYVEEDDYDEEYGQEYYQEYGVEAQTAKIQETEEEMAIRLSKEQFEADQAARKAKQKQELQALITQLEIEFNYEFTREQIQGTLQNYKMDMEKTQEQLAFKRKLMHKSGKDNKKAEIKAKVIQQKIDDEKRQHEQFLLEQENSKKAQKGKGKDKYEESKDGRGTREKEEVVIDLKKFNEAYPEVSYDTSQLNLTETETSNLNLVVIGHVDSGKSTLTGHLLVKLGYVGSSQMRKNEKKVEEYGKGGFQFAYILDETEEEQRRGVTIEVTTRYMQTPNRRFTILDAPGHRDFVANMITGAAQANCAVLVIDCQQTAFERGWNALHGTTKEHAILARSLGVTQLIVAMNKMEKIDYDQERFESIKGTVEPYLKRIGFKPSDITFVPISGLVGENLCNKATEERLVSWYGEDSPCLVDLLDKLRTPARNYVKPLRAAVSEYMSKSAGPLIGDCLSAKIEAGLIREGDKVLVLPQNVIGQVKGLLSEEESVSYALAGTIAEIGMKFPADYDTSFMKKGAVICDPRYPIKMVKSFIARVIIYDVTQPILKGEPIVAHSHISKMPGKIQFLLATVDQNTGETIKNRPKMLRKGQFANIQVKLEDRLCLELFSNYKNLGRICLRKEMHTIAAGTIIELVA